MAKKELTVSVYITGNGITASYDDLPAAEQLYWSNRWNKTALESAGFIQAE